MELEGAHLAWLSCCCLLLIHYLPQRGAAANVTALNIHLLVDPKNVTINHCHPSLSVGSLSFFSPASLFIFLTLSIHSSSLQSILLFDLLSISLSSPCPLTPLPHLLSYFFFFYPSFLFSFSFSLKQKRSLCFVIFFITIHGNNILMLVRLKHICLYNTQNPFDLQHAFIQFLHLGVLWLNSP